MAVKGAHMITEKRIIDNFVGVQQIADDILMVQVGTIAAKLANY